jgi:tetratricopeptide (TPR) repeat protein
MNEAEHLHYQRAHELSELNRWQDSILESQKCLSIDPHHYQALCNISRCYLELEDYEKTLEFAQKAIEADPTQEWAYRLQACVYNRKNKTKKHYQQALEAVKREPESVLALQTLAYAQLQRHKFNDATQTAEKIRRLAPDSVESHKTLGYVEFSKGNLVQAEEHFRRALKVEAIDYDALNLLGKVLIERHQKTTTYELKPQILNEAIDCFRQAVAIDPNRAEAKENLKKAHFNSLSSSLYIILPVIISIFLLICLVLNSKAYAQYRPEFLNVDGKKPELFILFYCSWISILFTAWGIAGFKGEEKLTETNKDVLEKVQDNNHYAKLLIVFWLLFCTYPLIFLIWKLVVFDFRIFYIFNLLDWITLGGGLVALGLNTTLIIPHLFKKESRF